MPHCVIPTILFNRGMEWKVSTEPVAYEHAVAFMEDRVAAIRGGAAAECIWALQHPPLYTAGTSAKASGLVNARFPVFETGRGGEYTYHGPGQLVMYVMLDLTKRQATPDLRAYVHGLEEWIIQSLAAVGVTGERREGRIGIWVATGNTEKKIAAIGVRVRRGVTYHGLSVNVNPDLTHFSGIIPCGISEYGVTSLQDLGVDIIPEAFATVMKACVHHVAA